MVVCVCACFHPDTLVQTEGGVKPISLLNPNELVLTKKGRWTQFLIYIHREDSFQGNFVVFKFQNGKNLKVTGDHLLCIQESGGRNQKIYKKAHDVTQGESMFHYNDEGREKIVPVVEIRRETGTGIYAPLTTTGHFLANGFLVTCFSDVRTFTVPQLSFTPLRLWKSMKSGFASSINHNNDETKGKKPLGTFGIHAYASTLMKCRQFLPLCLRNRL